MAAACAAAPAASSNDSRLDARARAAPQATLPSHPKLALTAVTAHARHAPLEHALSRYQRATL